MEIREITGDNFQTEVTGADQPVLVEFYADWCSPCKAQLPILMEAAEEACDVRFCRVNIEKAPELAEKYGISSVPTMLLMNGEKIFRTIIGFQPLEAILEYLEM
ncbi:MAG: thioredoxin family protein [Clostridiales bacterium]|nr:thioredoxin family protein [Clostridiales bacterium]